MLVYSASFAVKREKVDLSLKDISIEEFLKIVSKIYGKNILITQPISGTVNFVGSSPIYTDELPDILLVVLENKGFTLVESGSFYKLVRASIATKENLPVVRSIKKRKFMVTKAIRIENENVDVVVQKIRHLLSPSGRVVTMPQSNTMLVSEYPQNIETITKVIYSLVKNSAKKVKFIELKYANVDNVFGQINSIVKARYNQKILSNQFTVLKNNASNSIIVVGTHAQIRSVEGIIKKLDQEQDLGTYQTEIIRLTHTDATTLAKTLTGLLAKTTNPKQSKKPFITADAEMNSLVVVSLFDDLDSIKKLIKNLDVPRQQVFVKATIIELNNNKAQRIGLDYGVSLAGGDLGTGIYAIGANLAKKGTARSDALLIEAVKENENTLFALDVGLHFLQSHGAAQMLSEPSILCVNNKQSNIYVGKTISFQTASNTQTTGGTINSYSRQDVGLTLTVKPRISSQNLVALEISAQLENVSGFVNGQPTTSKSRVKTNAIVKNGENVILGGLVREDETKNEEGLPLISKIPFIGRLFRTNYDTGSKQNLIIIITPYIVSGENDLRRLRKKLLEKEKERNKYIKKILEDK